MCFDWIILTRPLALLDVQGKRVEPTYFCFV